MRALALLICALLLPCAALAQTNPGPQTPGAYAGSIPAQPSTGSAVSGALGEFASVQDDASTCSMTSTNASPTVITCSGNTFAARCIGNFRCVFSINFTGLVTGTTGIAISTNYYICTGSNTGNISGSTFSVATTVANCLAGTYVNTTGTDSGTVVASGYETTSATNQTVLSLYLTGGDFDCSGGVVSAGVASTTPTVLGANMVASGSSTTPNDGASTKLSLNYTVGVPAPNVLAGVKRFTLAAGPTAVGINLFETWSGGATNPTSTGLFRCRRAE